MLFSGRNIYSAICGPIWMKPSPQFRGKWGK